MGLGTFADHVGEDNFVSRIKGDPNPCVAQDSLKLLDGLQVGFFLADKGPHLVELALGDHQVLEQGSRDSVGMARRPAEDPQNCLLVNIRDSCRGSDTHTFSQATSNGSKELFFKVGVVKSRVSSWSGATTRSTNHNGLLRVKE